MASPNVGELVATTLERRSGETADNVTKHSSLFTWLAKKGNVEPGTLGRKVYEELEYAANGNASFYSGYDQVAINQTEALDAAEFAIKQAVCAVVISGLEELQNSGEEQVINLVNKKILNGEHSMQNMMGSSVFGSGTSYGGKEIVGLGAMVPTNPATGIYGGINRATSGNEFWASQTSTGDSGAESKSTIQTSFNGLHIKQVRGTDKPDLGICSAEPFALYEASLQELQRFATPGEADLGFPSLLYKGFPILYDSNCTANTVFFLNSRYIHYRPHSKRNMVPLPKRNPADQDVSVTLLVWAGVLTCANASLQGRLTIS